MLGNNKAEDCSQVRGEGGVGAKLLRARDVWGPRRR